jgi:hypothetical protein
MKTILIAAILGAFVFSSALAQQKQATPPEAALSVEALKKLGAKGVVGKVEQKLPDGILISLTVASYYTPFTLYPEKTLVPYERIGAAGAPGQLVLVKNLPDQDKIVEDDMLCLVGFPQGTWEHEGRTIRVFSATVSGRK